MAAETDRTLMTLGALGLLGGAGYLLYKETQKPQAGYQPPPMNDPRYAQWQADQLVNQYAQDRQISPRQAIDQLASMGCQAVAAYYTSGASVASGAGGPLCDIVAKYSNDITEYTARKTWDGLKWVGGGVKKLKFW